jgi:hypothetical protein
MFAVLDFVGLEGELLKHMGGELVMFQVDGYQYVVLGAVILLLRHYTHCPTLLGYKSTVPLNHDRLGHSSFTINIPIQATIHH